MTRLETVTGRSGRTPSRAPLLKAPLLTSRLHIDLLRVCSAIGPRL
ncbi:MULTISPECIES: putative leader peptide [Streptomyces]|nr:putative leader peptide [Streptomyces seoulensis]